MGLWRHVRYFLEFGLVYPFARVVVPLLEAMYSNNKPQFSRDMDDIATRYDIGSQGISRLSEMLSRKVSSGGTTGVPITFYEYFWVTILERMHILYLWSLVGWKPTHRTVVFRGDRIDSPTERRGRMLVISSYTIARDASRMAAEVAAFRPQWVWAYPSVFFSFQRIVDTQIEFENLIGFLFGSEKLYNWQRDELAEKYGEARLLDWYGSSEKVALAYRIYPDQNFTLVRSYSKVLLKPISSEDTWPRSCALIGSSYFQSPTRIRNYDIGDIVIVDPDGTIIDILGREQDFIFLKEGKPAPFSQMIGSIHSDLWEAVRRFRFEQERVGELEVYIHQTLPGGCATLREQFEALIVPALGGAVELNFHFGAIEPCRSASGKELYFVQRLGPRKVGDNRIGNT